MIATPLDARRGAPPEFEKRIAARERDVARGATS
jgi:hypothetical protein